MYFAGETALTRYLTGELFSQLDQFIAEHSSISHHRVKEFEQITKSNIKRTNRRNAQ